MVLIFRICLVRYGMFALSEKVYSLLYQVNVSNCDVQVLGTQLDVT